MLENYIPIAIMIFFALAFGIVMSKASEWFGPRNPTEQKLTTYESGMLPIGDTRKRFNVRFYIVAMIFLVFDVDIIFFYPFCTIFPQTVLKHHALAGLMLVEMALFVVILLIAYFYAWGKGVFKWD